MITPRRARLRSYAKINLDLRVLHRRADGFHEIRSLFHTISLADRIDIEFVGGDHTDVSTICDVLALPQEQNLAHRAAVAFLERAGAKGRVRIRITKRIPMGGGLGGGSSNAASILLALPSLTGKTLPFADLWGLAAELGSDVPFFLQGGAAIALGRGEEIYPAPDLPALPGLLVSPGIAVSTAEAYGKLGRTGANAASARIVREFSSQFAPFYTGSGGVASSLASVAFPLGSGLGLNDFEAVVFQSHPELRDWKSRLADTGPLHAMMSGSGSSLFALYATSEAAKRAEEDLSSGNVRRFRLLSRRQYQRAWLRSLYPYSNQLWPPHPHHA
ncbi:MAG: 4-(cytidine 5'-diphospho)-2-C-methyl-D-erythritol kinase [Bryobacterales bacterium]|nr:4-(cytidine 5'-diphospho)-2-C-methyl-D-erythritol kinase [Bryobacterales bacterium]